MSIKMGVEPETASLRKPLNFLMEKASLLHPFLGHSESNGYHLVTVSKVSGGGKEPAIRCLLPTLVDLARKSDQEWSMTPKEVKYLVLLVNAHTEAFRSKIASFRPTLSAFSVAYEAVFADGQFITVAESAGESDDEDEEIDMR
jgi:hypothetical protein